MSTEERIKQDFAKWIESMPKPNEYNRMYGHHLTSFKAGALSERNKTIDEALKMIDDVKTRSLDKHGLIQFLQSLKV